MQRKQMRDVTVMVAGIVQGILRAPFHHLPPTPDLGRKQLVALGRDGGTECRIEPEDLGGLDEVGKEIPYQFFIVQGDGALGGAIRPLLRRPTIRRDELSGGGIHLETIVPELGDFLEHGIGLGGQKVPIKPVGVVLPHVLSIPGTAGGFHFQPLPP